MSDSRSPVPADLRAFAAAHAQQYTPEDLSIIARERYGYEWSANAIRAWLRRQGIAYAVDLDPDRATTVITLAQDTGLRVGTVMRLLLRDRVPIGYVDGMTCINTYSAGRFMHKYADRVDPRSVRGWYTLEQARRELGCRSERTAAHLLADVRQLVTVDDVVMYDPWAVLEVARARRRELRAVGGLRRVGRAHGAHV